MSNSLRLPSCGRALVSLIAVSLAVIAGCPQAARADIGDTSAPTAPAGLTAGPASATSVLLSWQPAADDVGVTRYDVWRWDSVGNWQLAGSVPGDTTAYTAEGLSPGTQYTFGLRAFDAAGNMSPASALIRVTTVQDPSAPTAPAGLVAGPASSTSVPLSWQPATDDVGITRYDVWRWDSVGNWQLVGS